MLDDMGVDFIFGMFGFGGELIEDDIEVVFVYIWLIWFDRICVV